MRTDIPFTSIVHDDRSVSTAFNYALALSVATVLTAGLLIAGGTFVDNQQDTAARTELNVLGNQLASDIEAADRLSRNVGSNDEVNITRELPNTVAGSQYTIRVRSSDPELVLNLTNSDVSVPIKLAVQQPVEATKVGGGNVQIVYSDPKLEVKDD